MTSCIDTLPQNPSETEKSPAVCSQAGGFPLNTPEISLFHDVIQMCLFYFRFTLRGSVTESHVINSQPQSTLWPITKQPSGHVTSLLTLCERHFSAPDSVNLVFIRCFCCSTSTKFHSTLICLWKAGFQIHLLKRHLVLVLIHYTLSPDFYFWFYGSSELEL